MKNLNVLIVEDEALVAEEIKDRLCRLGHNVIDMVDRGVDALRLATAEPSPDIILMDVRIKGDMDGIETAIEIRKHKFIPIIFISAHSDNNTLDRANNAAEFGYVIKPFSEQDLLVAIDLAMNRFHEEKIATDVRDRLQILYQIVDIGLVLVDQNLNIVECNKFFSALTGFHQSDLVGKPILSFYSQEALNNEGFDERLLIENQFGPMYVDINNRHGHGIYSSTRVVGFKSTDGGNSYWWIVDDISYKRRSEELIFRHANYDDLTGLPNRRLFHDRLNEAIARSSRSGDSITLIYLDIDNFKEVNDVLGHAVGDEVLKEISRRIKLCIRSTDTLARLGGDEFALILPDMKSKDRVESILEMIVSHMIAPVNIEQSSVYVTISSGVTVFPDDSLSAVDLLKFADQAMYAAKRIGKNQYSFFNQKMKDDIDLRHEIIQNLRGALLGNEFEVYYQPIINLESTETYKAEALLRWHSPKLGMIGPDIFIPLAEESGLICDIGDWVFRQAVLAVNDFYNLTGQRLQISVNKSPLQFVHKSVVQSWKSLLREFNLPINSITIEITEGVLIKDSPEVKEMLIEYRHSGIEVAIDDFGTGFSSLSYLKEFDIDYLKIDRSFINKLVTDDNDRALTEAIIMMANKLGLKTIAEGVETYEQASLLKTFGCNYAQGYYYSKPVPFNQVVEFFKTANNVNCL